MAQDILHVGSNKHTWGSEPVVDVHRLWVEKPSALDALPPATWVFNDSISVMGPNMESVNVHVAEGTRLGTHIDPH